MRSANIIMKKTINGAVFFLFLIPLAGYSQLNSPYSRYGIGNLSPQGNSAMRAMGGIAAGVAEFTSINSVNPAAYSNLVNPTLDFAIEYNRLNLKSKDPLSSFKSNDAIFSFLNVGIPLLSNNKKVLGKNHGWALSFGLKPISRIQYKNRISERTDIDSVSYIFNGEGGVNKAYFGSALKLNHFSFGFNTGYVFGDKDISTQQVFNNDTIDYSKINYKTQTNFGGMFLDLGAQYLIKLGKKTTSPFLRLGAYTSLKTTYRAKRDLVRESFDYDEFGGINRIDSLLEVTGEKGDVTLPAVYGFGFTYGNNNLMLGADFETSNWNDYLSYGSTDLTTNSWKAKAGVQYLPATNTSTSFLSFMQYRFGFSFGRDYLKIDDNLSFYTISAGIGVPLRLRRSFFDNQVSLMNVTMEYNSRGGKINNIVENTFKLTFGFSLSDVWFMRQKYQ